MQRPAEQPMQLVCVKCTRTPLLVCCGRAVLLISMSRATSECDDHSSNEAIYMGGEV